MLAACPSLMATPCLLSMIAYFTYLQLPSIFEGGCVLYLQLEGAPYDGGSNPFNNA
jgi:hypothetical protein